MAETLTVADSPLGPLTLVALVGGPAPRGALLGAWYAGQDHPWADPASKTVQVRPGEPGEPEVLVEARRWLEDYFEGRDPGAPPALAPRGTVFRQQVWYLLRQVPYGQTLTYGQLAAQVSARTGRRCSARAVGGAVGHNPISIMVPCHRVVGAGGAITGYAGGLERKEALLGLEGVRLTA